MKNLKKQVIASLVILALSLTSAQACEEDKQLINLSNKLFQFFPRSFYEDSKYLSRPYLKGDLQKINLIKNRIAKDSQDFVLSSLYYRKLDKLEDREAFFSDNRLQIKDGHRLAFENKNEFISNYYSKNYLKLELLGQKLMIHGVDGRSQTWSISFTSREGVNINPSYLQTIPIKYNSFTKTFQMEGGNISSLKINLNRHRLGSYYPSSYEFELDWKEGQLVFADPPSYQLNKETQLKGYQLDSKDFLSLDHLDSREKDQLSKKALELTQGLPSDYEKILAIHTWVAGNIFYDHDSLKYNKRGPNDAYTSYMNKRAVCQGYAELSLALARSIDIPCRLVYGYALGVNKPEEGWDKENLNKKSNHAWNEAYIDGRWIIFDPTWDSSNSYEEGKFKREDPGLRYFDPSLKAFSQSHRILEFIDL